MIVCHCNVLSCRSVRDVATAAMRPGANGRPVPAQVFRAYGKKAECGCCVGRMAEIIRETMASGAGECAACDCPSTVVAAAAE